MSFSRNDGTQFLSSAQIAQLYVNLVESELNEEIFFALGRNFISWYDIALAAKEMMPLSKSNIIATDEEGEHYYYNVSKMERVFGLSFDGWDDIKEHLRWNIERALAQKNGENLHSTLHEFC